jgi:serine/threonine protein kinase
VLTLLERIRVELRPRYEIADELGGGGMGVVYRARTADGREVALKILRPEIVRTLGPDRFLREIAILRAMDHPRIVPLLDAGAAVGVPWLVMPLIAGPTLRDVIDRAPGGVPLEQVVRTAREVGEAIDHAHRHGIMHRDIKPENILVTGGGCVVADFGLARAIEAAGDSFSSSGLVLGTPAYMSPEQASASGDVDARTDIYALGCVLYEMLTGEPPFTGASPQTVLARHTAERPPSLRTVRPDVPEHVERAVLAALEKSPDSRPRSGETLSRMIVRDQASR